MSGSKAILGNPCNLRPRSQISTGKSMEAVSFSKFPTSHLPQSQAKRLSIGGADKRHQNRASRVAATFKTQALKTDASFYELLGIPENGSISEIKQAYKQMARKYHPDVSPPDRTEEYTRRFILVHEAYETLSDPRLRAMYDKDLARGLHLAFSSRKRFDEESEVKSAWTNRWQDQLSELKRRSMYKDSEANMSWGARMRRQRSAASEE